MNRRIYLTGEEMINVRNCAVGGLQIYRIDRSTLANTARGLLSSLCKIVAGASIVLSSNIEIGGKTIKDVRVNRARYHPNSKAPILEVNFHKQRLILVCNPAR